MDCGTPGCKMNKGVALAKSSKGKYYVKCADCGDLISPYIPTRLIEEYIQERNLKCQFCGGEVRISKAGQPYCTVNYKHTVGFSVNDIIEKEPDEIRKKVNYKHTVGFSVNDIIEKEPDEIRKKKVMFAIPEGMF